MSAQMQPFEAEVGRVLDLVINSLYQHREIFLRELISNASDACDRLRYAALTEPGLLGDEPELKIVLAPDRDAGTLTVIDNGIGMSRDDLVDNLGTIARSGTQRFVEQLSGDNASDLNLIGQFGVGFYSAFMVAGQVEVISRKAGEEHAWRWQSDGRSGYTIEAADAAPRGTSVILHLREDAKEFLDEWRLRQIVRNYSDHIAVPILLKGAPKADDAAEGRRRGQGPGADQPGERALDPLEVGHHRRAVQGVLSPRRARLRRALGAPARQGGRRGVVSGAPVRAGLEAVRSVRSATSARREAVRAGGCSSPRTWKG